MARMCHFYRMPPSEYLHLEPDVLNALIRYRNECIEAEKQRQQKRG